ncbi:MAG: adenylate/guanylate cyclase domain-containing protein [Pseudomonadota bacterium]
MRSAVLFAELVADRNRLRAIPDAGLVEITTRGHELMTDVANRHQGRTVKTIGRGVLCVFSDAPQAAHAAGGMHLAMRQTPFPVVHRADETMMRNDLGLRIGIHSGPVLVEGGDVFGDTVNVAARLMELAKSEQTLCSTGLVEELGSEWCKQTRHIGRSTLRGKTAPVEVCELIWESRDLTMPAPTLPEIDAIKRHDLLRLRCNGRQVSVGPDRPNLTLGRHPTNDLVSNVALASRQHAEIEFRAGRFSLVDRSSNGTFIRQSGRIRAVHNERYTLDGEGEITLGEQQVSATEVIHFECL